jgi:tetratricopeptide (TPR) repeat protein
MALRLHPRERIGWFEAAVASAQRMNDPFAEGRHLGNLGLAYAALGEMRRAIKHHEQALAISREIGDRRGEGNALWNTALALDELGERAQATANAEVALEIREQIEDSNAGKVRDKLAEWRGQE